MEASDSYPHDISPADIWISGSLLGYQIPQSRPPLRFDESFMKILNTRIMVPHNRTKAFNQQVEKVVKYQEQIICCSFIGGGVVANIELKYLKQQLLYKTK